MLTPSPKDVAVLHHDVADIDANAKPHATFLGEGLVGLGKISLDLHGALHGGKNAAELGENTVASCAANPTAVLRDERVGDCAMV